MNNRKKEIKSVKIKLSKGTALKSDLSRLNKNLKKIYEKNRRDINVYVECIAFEELKKRLVTSVYAKVGESYPNGYKKYCMCVEYHNTKLQIKCIKTLISKAKKSGCDILGSDFYSVKNCKYRLTWESYVHIHFRHDPHFLSMRNQDSVYSGYNPSEHENSAIAILQMFKALEAIDSSDWITSFNGNLIVHYTLAGSCYTIIRNKETFEILSTFPRDSKDDIKLIHLIRKDDKYIFEKVNNKV